MAMSKHDQKAMEQQGREITRLREQVAQLEAQLRQAQEGSRKEVLRLQALRTDVSSAHESVRSLNLQLSKMARESNQTTTQIALDAVAGYAELVLKSLQAALNASYQ